MPLIIKMPRCEWCNRCSNLYIFKCGSCKKWTCMDCLTGYSSSDKCTHHKYELIQGGDGW